MFTPSFIPGWLRRKITYFLVSAATSSAAVPSVAPYFFIGVEIVVKVAKGGHLGA